MDWVSEKFQINCEAQDRWACRSRSSFGKAQATGRFEAEIVPVKVPRRKGTPVFAKDKHNRLDTTLEALAKLKPEFSKAVTAGNDPGLGSGASAMIVAGADWAEKRGFSVSAVAAAMFGLGPVSAVRQALERDDWKRRDVERAEVNEALPAVVLAISQELSLPEDIVNVEGGAIAYDHPIGVTGADLTTRLLHAIKRDGVPRGLVTLRIGGGQGVGLALEAMH
jgi:acetyl-CoA C-acetyltransferase